jgi:carbon monoxide dehydrogenase subunit G
MEPSIHPAQTRAALKREMRAVGWRGGPAVADYHYVSTWQLQAPIERLWAALNDLEHLATWYTGMQKARELTPGDAQGVGRRVRYVIKGRLPLRLAFEATTTRSVPPRDQELQAEGELAGTGRWSLEQQGEVTTVRYYWNVRTTGPWMNLLAPLARPLFTWNSKGVMLQAGEGLARFLGVPLVAAEFTAPPWLGTRRLGWAALATLAVWLVGRRVRSARHG